MNGPSNSCKSVNDINWKRVMLLYSLTVPVYWIRFYFNFELSLNEIHVSKLLNTSYIMKLVQQMQFYLQ